MDVYNYNYDKTYDDIIFYFHLKLVFYNYDKFLHKKLVLIQKNKLIKKWDFYL